MSDPVDALVTDLLEWIGPRTRPYTEVIDVWRTSCPRLPVWEEANARGYVVREHLPGIGAITRTDETRNAIAKSSANAVTFESRSPFSSSSSN